MDRAETRRFRRILESHREEALRLLDRSCEEARSLVADCPQDRGDSSITSLSKEDLFQQSNLRRLLVRMIDSALERVKEGTFGVCVGCGDDVQPKRLEALPWTQYCLRCQELIEQEGELKSASDALQAGITWKQAG
jgi:DnaK suppressor protein